MSYAAAAYAMYAGYQAYAANSAARETNKQARKMFYSQMDHNERMSNTAYLRASRDMKAAGLNPAMMLGGSGGAASTPSAPNAPQQSATSDEKAVADALLAGANAAQSFKRTEADINATEKSAKNLDEASKTQQTTRLLQNQQENKTKLEADKTAADLSRMRDAEPAVRAENSARVVQANADKASAAAQAAEASVRLKNAQDRDKNHSWDSSLRRVNESIGVLNNASSVVKPWTSGNSKSGGYTEEQYNSQGEHVGTRSRRYQ